MLKSGFQTIVVLLAAASLSSAATAIVASGGESCSTVDKSGVSTFIIKAKTPAFGEINNMLIKFNTTRKLPISSTAFHDGLNAQKLVNRDSEPFGPLPCPQLPVNGAQQNCTGGFSMTEAQRNTSGRFTWDRGHLTPVNPMRFSEDAVNKTFFCVNIAPQDSYTNQNPWKDVEVKSEVKLRSTDGAFVQTGLCSEDNSVDGPLTYRNWRIPTCFWKLICYKDASGTVQVVGFIGENTLTGIKDTAAQTRRTEATTTPRSQEEILKRLSTPTVVGEAWTTAVSSLIADRNVTKSKLPTAAKCKAALTVSPEVSAEWAKAIKA